MAYLQEVTVTSGVPTAGSGTVPTLAQGRSSGVVAVTRPANTTAYTANDVVGGAITFPTMGSSGGGEVIITSLVFEIDIAALPTGMSIFNLYLYNVTPPSAIADNSPFDIPSGDRSALLGKIVIGTPIDEGSTLRVELDQINKQITVPSGGTIFGYLVTAAAYTPAANSEVYNVMIKSVGC